MWPSSHKLHPKYQGKGNITISSILSYLLNRTGAQTLQTPYVLIFWFCMCFCPLLCAFACFCMFFRFVLKDLSLLFFSFY